MFLLFYTTVSGQNGLCVDSSFRIRYTAPFDLAVRDHLTTRDSGTLAFGQFGNSAAGGSFVTRLNKEGNVQWARKVLLTDGSLGINKVLELANGDFLLMGRTSNPYSIAVMRFSAVGNVVWTRSFNGAPHFNPDDALYSFAMAEGGDGSLVAGWNGIHIGPPNQQQDSSYAAIVKLASDGALTWSKAFVSNNDVRTHISNLFVEGGEVVVFGQVTDQHPACNGDGNFFAMKLDYSTGNLAKLNAFCYTEPAGSTLTQTGALERLFQASRLSSGRFVLSGLFSRNNPGTNFYSIHLDDGFNLIKSSYYKSASSFSIASSRILVLSGGGVLISSRNSAAGRTYWAHLDSNNALLAQKKVLFTGSEVQANGFAERPGNNFSMVTNFDQNGQRYLEYAQLQAGDPGIDSCLGMDTSFLNLYPFTVAPSTWAWKWIVNNPIAPLNLSYEISSFNFQAEEVCKRVSYCDSLKIIGPETVCVFGQETEFRAFRNSACGKRVEWEVEPGAVLTATAVNDSTFRIRFRLPGNGRRYTWLYASVRTACGLRKDSLRVELFPTLQPLPSDTTLCTGNSLRLSPGYWFKTYRWQDGSTDSTFTVTAPGTYHVTIQTYCGQELTDTIQVAIPFLQLPDTVYKCSYDTVILRAGPGFSTYQWLATTHATVLNDSLLKVYSSFPGYQLVQASTLGCTARDSSFIAIYPSPGLSLGADTSFCEGAELTLQADPFFQSYEWSDGSTGPSLTVSRSGIYGLKATDAYGCVIGDTVEILPLLPSPEPGIFPRAVACMGQTDTLRASSGFASYIWQDGSVLPYHPVTQPGIYRLQVTDMHGCLGEDSVEITVLQPGPAKFLPSDTVICQEQAYELNSTAHFRTYSWSNGAYTASIRVNAPGTYSLEVSDENGCRGRDTIYIAIKPCPNKFYMPSAFSPNGDGRNELIRPLIQGVLELYEFRIFNRWGTLVFSTRDPAQAWDGRLQGILQPLGSFVWTCRYQFKNESIRQERGVMTLVR